MSRTELLAEGLVILPSAIAPEPSDGESGNTAPSVFPSGAGGGVAIPSGESWDELAAEEPVRTVLPVSSASAWSPRASRSDTGVTAWRLTPKAISHLFGSPNPPYRRVDEILFLPVRGTAEREPGGTSNFSGRT